MLFGPPKLSCVERSFVAVKMSSYELLFPKLADSAKYTQTVVPGAAISASRARRSAAIPPAQIAANRALDAFR